MQKQKAIGMALGTLAVFLICMFPYNISHVVGYIEGESPKWRVVMEITVRSEVILSVYIISFLIGLPANLLALYAFSVKIHSKPVPIDILLLNLAVSDLLFLFILPLKMHEAASGMKWDFSNFLCSITAFTFFSTISTSALFLSAVSVLRYIAVAYPVTYHHLHKPVYAIVISAVIWIISTAHCSITFIVQLHPNLANHNSTICYENFTEKQLEILLPVRVVMEQVVRSEVILSVYIISFLIGLPANLLALYAFSVKIHSKPVPIDILLLNLIVSDLLFLFILPLKMHEAASGMKWDLSSFLCSITSFTFFSSIYTSALLLSAVSVLRYIAVAYPVTYHHLHKPVYAIVISAVIWIISTAHCSITFIVQLHPSLTNKNSTFCYENFTEKQLEILLPVRLEMFFVLCLVPLMICVYCYMSCIWILYSRPRISQMQKQKAIGMALGTLAVFLICVFPYNLSHVVGYIEVHK
ncbi:hypothetical protein Q5P01_011574 [Channa striata]|uniref:G-protein coupled receptors family 1 profile domain-containing protein n=1 Tax=Channa striata TaxID=64152 RepID=A0AA88SN07_CHASR|nr:hypothetical protein Q5P01_011574 [Channa striata]